MRSHLKALLLCLVSFSVSFAQILTGTLSTTENDVNKPVRVIAKHGDLVVLDSTFLLGGTYTADWSTVGVDNFDYMLPQPKLLGMANSVSNDGNIYPIVSGDHGQVSYRIYNIQGREIQGRSNIPAGKYFLQLMNKSNGELLGVQSFVLLNNHLRIEFKSNVSTTRLQKPAEDADSLIVIYEDDDMELEPYREAVVVPEGVETRDIILTRTLRGPVFELTNLPENPTIDQDYLAWFDFYHPDYDAYVNHVGLVHDLGGVDYYFNGLDSLVISPHEGGSYTFNITIRDSRSDSLSQDYGLEVESITHLIQTLDFFYALDEPYPGLEVYLRDKYSLTDIDGIAKLEFPSTAPPLTIQDSIEIYHPANDTTFYAMRLPVDTAVDTQKVQTFTDNRGPSYWNGWTWDNLWHRISGLGGIPNNPGFGILRVGSLQNGPSSVIAVYCPNYTSPDGLEYRPIVEELLQDLNQDLDERAGIGNQSGAQFYLLPISESDSLIAADSGMVLYFEQGQPNHTILDIEFEGSVAYIKNVDAYVSSGISNSELGIQRLKNLVHHEMIQHGTGDLAHSPYNPNQSGGEDVQENMISGAIGTLKEHEKDAVFTKLNLDYSNITHLVGYEYFHEGNSEPTSLGKRTTNTTTIPHFCSPNVTYEITEKEGTIEKGRIDIKD